MANGWEPINSAPKDGTKILLGRFVPGCEHDGRVRIDWWRSHIKAGFTGFGKFNPVYWPATHWMHLPPRPDRDGGAA